jgi:hypothetical protein
MVVFAGSAGELLAARAIEPGKYTVVVFREARREQVWPR